MGALMVLLLTETKKFNVLSVIVLLYITMDGIIVTVTQSQVSLEGHLGGYIAGVLIMLTYKIIEKWRVIHVSRIQEEMERRH